MEITINEITKVEFKPITICIECQTEDELLSLYRATHLGSCIIGTTAMQNLQTNVKKPNKYSIAGLQGHLYTLVKARGYTSSGTSW